MVYGVGGLLALLSFGLQVLVVSWIILLARKVTDPAPEGRRPRFDVIGTVLSAAGLFFVVLGAAAVQDLRLRQVAAGFHHRQHGGDLEGIALPGVDTRGDRRPVPAVVLPVHPVRGEKAQGRAAAPAAVPQQGL
jgi:hypothetical protein